MTHDPRHLLGFFVNYLTIFDLDGFKMKDHESSSKYFKYFFVVVIVVFLWTQVCKINDSFDKNTEYFQVIILLNVLFFFQFGRYRY